MRIHWPRLARLCLPGSVCLSVHLLVRLQLSALLYGCRSTYQCVSRRLGETAHSALDKGKSRLQIHPVYTPTCLSAVCIIYAGLHVCSVSPSHAYPRPRGTGDREEKGRAKFEFRYEVGQGIAIRMYKYIRRKLRKTLE